jgi:hypothetical protein
VTRRLLIGAALLLELAKAMAPELMRTDPRGLAALHMAAFRMTEGAHASMTEVRNLAERSMKAKCALMLPGPPDADRHAHRDGQRNGDRDDERADSDRQPFADLISRTICRSTTALSTRSGATATRSAARSRMSNSLMMAAVSRSR